MRTSRRDPRTGQFVKMVSTQIPLMKPCAKCLAPKGVDEFGIDQRRSDGRKSWCRGCCSRAEMDRRLANPEKVRAQDRQLARKTIRNASLRARRKRDEAWRLKQNVIRTLHYQRERNGITNDALYVRDRGICHICDGGVERSEVEADHIVPISRGGAVGDASNIGLAHRSCNRRKSAMMIEEFRDRQDRELARPRR